MDATDRILLTLPFRKVRSAYIKRAQIEAARRDDVTTYMHGYGFEKISVEDDALLTDDGREIVRFNDVSWSLREAEHAKSVRQIFEAEFTKVFTSEEQKPNNVFPRACSALIDGQLCGGSLSATPVCPRCALGKQGVAQIMICDVCGVQTAVMR